MLEMCNSCDMGTISDDKLCFVTDDVAHDAQ